MKGTVKGAVNENEHENENENDSFVVSLAFSLSLLQAEPSSCKTRSSLLRVLLLPGRPRRPYRVVLIG